MVRDSAPATPGEYVRRSMAGEILPPFAARPAYLIGWEGKINGQWSRGEYLRPE